MKKIVLSDIFIGNYRITQKFGVNPRIYKRFGLKGHSGADFACPNGTMLVAPFDCEVLKVGNSPGGYGLYVKLWTRVPEFELWGQKIGGVCAIFAHCKSVVVKPGQKVKCGQLIAYSNNTGFSTGAHLHFGILYTDKNGYRLFRDNGFLGWQDPLNKELFKWQVKNLKKPVCVDEEEKSDLAKCLEAHKQAMDWANREKAEKEKLQTELDIIRMEKETIGKQLSDLKVYSEDLEKKNKELVQKNRKYESQLADWQKRIETANRKISKLEEEIKKLEKEKQDYKRWYENALAKTLERASLRLLVREIIRRITNGSK